MNNTPTEYKLMPLPATQEMLLAGANVSMEITPRQISRIYEAMWKVVALVISRRPDRAGQPPDGKTISGEESKVGISIGSDGQNNVHFYFGKPITFLGMAQVSAVSFAREILKAAGAKKVEIEI